MEKNQYKFTMKKNLINFILTITLVVAVTLSWANSPTINNYSFDKIEVADNDTTNTPPSLPGEDFVPIIIRKILKDSDDGRSLIPISALYNNEVIELDFYGNLGTLYVVVNNNTTGERWSEYIDTIDGVALMDVTSYNPSGYYTITFYSDKHGNYGGEFYVE